MSRAQQTQTFNTATSENAENEPVAQNANANEAEDIGSYQSALSKFAASNPYVQGGQAATTANQIASGTAGGAAAGTRAELQDQAKRTGQDPNAANATAVSADQASERTVANQEAEANQDRIGNEAKFNQGVLSDTGDLSSMENRLSSTAGGEADDQLSLAQKAGGQPSWLDDFGSALGSSLGTGVGTAAASFV